MGSYCCVYYLQQRATMELEIKGKLELIVEDRVRNAVSKDHN